MNVIQCYAPTNAINDANKYQFYKRLQQIIAMCSRMDLTVLMEDLNAEVRMDNTRYKDIMGRYGLTRGKGRERSENCAFMFIQ